MSIQLLDPDFEQRVQGTAAKNRFMQELGLQLTHVELGKVQVYLQLAPWHRQQFGVLHGGVTASICDICAGFAAYTAVARHQHVVTASLNMHYLEPGIGNEVQAAGWVVRQGSTSLYCEAEIWLPDKKKNHMLAKASAQMAVVSESDLAKAGIKI